jgi:DegV family protein with EDD domain
LDELADWAEENRLKLCHWFTVDDLMFLKRGGRVSAATALVGTMLQIKPILHVDDEGRLTKLGTIRGRKGSIAALKDHLKEAITNPEEQTIYISHGDCEDEARLLADMIAKEVPVKGFVFNHVGPVIGAHTGAGVIALFCVGKQR